MQGGLSTPPAGARPRNYLDGRVVTLRFDVGGPADPAALAGAPTTGSVKWTVENSFCCLVL
jgi:hypothetical protein